MLPLKTKQNKKRSWKPGGREGKAAVKKKKPPQLLGVSNGIVTRLGILGRTSWSPTVTTNC